MAATISLCMIARNEERNIGRCLQSITGMVDEIIVVDTGSVDKTCQIARSFGAKVQAYMWNNNFSDARNAAIDLATGDWIMFLDADEELAPDSGASLRQAVLNPVVEGYFIKKVNLSGNDSFPESSVDMALRLFRNKPEYRFQGAVHEQICDIITEKFAGSKYQINEDVAIYHYGYLNSYLKGKDTLRRSRILLEEELSKKPDDLLLRFQYALELCRTKEYLPAAWEFEKTADMMNLKEAIYGPQVMRYIVCAYYGANEPAAALAAIQKGAAIFPDYADLYFYGGRIYLQLREYKLAYEFFLKALQAPGQPVYYASFAGVQGFRSYYYLGKIAEKFGNEEEALRYYLDSLRDNSNFITALDDIMGILQPRINPDYTRCAIEKICDISLPQAKLQMGRLFFKHGAYGLALEYFQEAAGAVFTSEVLIEKAVCLIQQRRGSEALVILEAINETDKLNPYAKFIKLIGYWFEEDRQTVWQLGEELLAVGLSEDTAAVIELLRNTYNRNAPVLIGREGMTLVLDILRRALDLGGVNLCITLVLGISPQSLPDYYLLLGKLFYQYRHAEPAEQYLCRHIEKNGGSNEAYFLLGEIKQAQELYFDAIAYYQKALQSDPKEPEYYSRLINLYGKVCNELQQQKVDKWGSGLSC